MGEGCGHAAALLLTHAEPADDGHEAVAPDGIRDPLECTGSAFVSGPAPDLLLHLRQMRSECCIRTLNEARRIPSACCLLP